MTTEIRTTHSVEHNCHGNLIRDGFHVIGIPDETGAIFWGLRATNTTAEQAARLANVPEHTTGKLRAVRFCPWCGEEFPTGAHPPAEVNPYKPKPWNQIVVPEPMKEN